MSSSISSPTIETCDVELTLKRDGEPYYLQSISHSMLEAEYNVEPAEVSDKLLFDVFDIFELFDKFDILWYVLVLCVI